MALATQGPMDFSALEAVLVGGDLAALSPEQRVDYYARVCASLGLNPLTRPFQYITFEGKLRLYASKDCTEQLAATRGVTVELDDGRDFCDTWIVKARATDPTGRTADATGAIFIGGSKGQALANNLMKAETKASRRAVLRLCGLGMLDETEAETVPNAATVVVDQDGVIQEPGAAPVTRLQNRIESEGMQWHDFLATVLGVETFPQYVSEGGTAGSAWQLFQDSIGTRLNTEVVEEGNDGTD